MSSFGVYYYITFGIRADRMTRRICIIQWRIMNVAVTVESLRVVQVGYNAIRLNKVVKIRVIRAGNVTYLKSTCSLNEGFAVETCAGHALSPAAMIYTPDAARRRERRNPEREVASTWPQCAKIDQNKACSLSTYAKKKP